MPGRKAPELHAALRSTLVNQPHREISDHAMSVLKRKSRAQLDFAAGSHGHGDGAELRGVDKTVGRAEVCFVQGVEGFGAKLEVGSFRQVKRAF